MGVASFMPDTFQEGGGLWDNLDLRFTNCRIMSNWDYQGKGQSGPALVVDLVSVSNDTEVIVQGWSIGAAKDYSATSDGKVAVEVGDMILGPQLRKGSNVVILFESIADAVPDSGKDEALMKLLGRGKASDLNGLEAHMIRKVVDRPGLEKKKSSDGKVYDFTVPVVDTILKFPWDKKAPPGVKGGAKPAGAAAKPAATPPPAAATNAAVEETAMTQVGLVLAGAQDGMDRASLSQEVFKAVKDGKMRAAVVKMVYDKAWLVAKGEEGGWQYDEESDTVVPG